MERETVPRPSRAQLTLQPGAIELRQHREDYEALRADLEEHGWTVTVEQPFEERSALGQQALDEALRVLAFVGDHATDAALTYLFATIVRHLRRPPRPRWPKRRMPIYGPTGDLLSVVELDASDLDPEDDTAHSA